MDEPAEFRDALEIAGRARAPTQRVPAGNGRPQPPIARRTTRTLARKTLGNWALLLILGLQAGLSAHFLTLNSAYQDEALYLWAGRLQLLHWFHGAATPPFATYFSGSPIAYPPLAALVDAVGGLVAVRLLSLGLMLTATALLWATANRLLDRNAGLIAAATWSLLGPTLLLGAYGTYDAMAIALLALAAWSAVRASETVDFTGWIIVGALALVASNAVCYSYAVFDPFVVALIYLGNNSVATTRIAWMRVASFVLYVVTVFVLFLALWGAMYLTGIDQTVLARVHGTSGAAQVIDLSWKWSAPVIAMAGLAAILALLRERNRGLRFLVVILALAVLVVPVEQARIETTVSLWKHVDAGSWFACLSVGYLGSRLVSLGRARLLQRLMVCTAIACYGVLQSGAGLAQATALDDWPNSLPTVAVLRPLVEQTTGPILIENPAPIRYYLGPSVPWQRYSSTFAVTFPDGRSLGSAGPVGKAGRPSTYRSLVRRGFFSLIALNGTATPALDRKIEQAVAASPRYEYVAEAPNGGSPYSVYERIGR